MIDIKQKISAEALSIVTGARRAAYGKPEQNFARIARLWEGHLINTGVLPEEAPSGPRILPRDVAAMMRLMKEARLAETPGHRDSYVDLVGYALCGAEVAGVAPKSKEPDALIGAPEIFAFESGKAYRTRDGEKVRGAVDEDGELHAPDGRVWQRCGARYTPGNEQDHIVAEWIEGDAA